MKEVKKSWHSLKEKEVLRQLGSNEKGLTNKEARVRLIKYGENKLPEKKKKSQIWLFIKEFHSVLIYILLVAALISFLVKHLIDMVLILTIVLINATIGFIQERKAEKAIASLKKMIVAYAKVYRDGKLVKLPTNKLIPGDIIFLEEGDRIPADCRLIEVKNFRTDESSLTGESTPIDKELKILPIKITFVDRINMIFMGTIAVAGSAKAVVVATGAKTEIGKVAQSITEIKPPKMHFEKKVDELAIQMGLIAILGAGLTFLIGFFIRKFGFFDIFLFTLASLVSGIPEGLPAVLAIVLSIGAYRMAKKNAIIRHLPAVETLGVATVIATDKTGTLTQNQMTVEKILIPSQPEISVSGKGWTPKGNFYQGKKLIDINKNFQLQKLLQIATLCNNSQLTKTDGKYNIIGDPTEVALIVAARKAGIDNKKLLKKIQKIDDLPFNPQLKYRASLSVLIKDRKKEIYSIGAFEKILDVCKINVKRKKEFLEQGEKMARQGLRVLGLASKKMPSYLKKLEEGYIHDMDFVGFVAMKDPPRPEVKEAIKKARNAGIRIIMKTGDHKETALAIGIEVGLCKKNCKVLTEKELEKMSKKQFSKAVKKVSIFARVTPNMKMKIISALQNQGEIVAMTGDGINDAPALKKANIGVSMGIIGTDVAREASEVVLADDNFASIVNAIEEGRIVFQNVRQTSFFLITTNIAEDVTIIGSLILFMPLPLLPIHLLWLNLVTDGLNDVALATEPGHHDVLIEKPRKKQEKLINKDLIPFLILTAGLMAICSIPLFRYFLPNEIKARTVVFISMSFFQLFNVFNMRSLKKSVFKIGIFTNKFINWAIFSSIALLLAIIYIPFFANIFQFTPISLIEFLIIVIISSSILWFGEIYKYLKRNGKSE